MVVAGIDGCKQGWLMVKHQPEGYSYGVYASFKALVAANPDLNRIFIDIPIGLSSLGFKRTLESSIRKELPGRQSTVFNPPCREALVFDNYQLAKNENKKIEGKAISVQAFNISKKIREVDNYLLQNDPPFEFFESHPELCFKYLHPRRKVLPTKKSTPEGVEERLKILSNYDNGIPAFYQKILQNTMRKDVKKDDILDAICLCLTNKMAGQTQMKIFQDENKRDLQGIPVRIVCLNRGN